MAFSILTFGGLRLVDGEGNIVPFPEKGLLIIAFLLTSNKTLERRATLARFLWGDEDRGVSFTNLRTTILRIRKRQDEIGTQFLSFTESTVRLDQTSLHSDTLLFDAQEKEAPFSRLSRLVEQLGQIFLGTFAGKSPDFEEWITRQRRMHLVLLKELLKKAAPVATSEEEIELVKNGAVIAFGIKPEDSDIQKILLEITGAQDEVEYLRTLFKKRDALLAKGDVIDAVASKADVEGKQRGTRRPMSGLSLSEVGLSIAPGKTAIPRLVLLLPSNQSDNLNASMVASSLIEDLTIGFCALGSLQVIAPHSAIQISRQRENQVDFFERHSVNYVFDTRLTSLGGDITLFSQLIYFTDNTIIWAERFSLDPQDLVRDRRVIARRLALSVASEIERYELTRSYLELHPAAYHHYLLGRRYLASLTLPNLRRARKELRAALHESPDFAPALSAVARTYSKEWLLTARGDAELLKSAETFATKAKIASREMPDGHREFGVAKLLQGALDESAEALELAETLGPHYADVIADHADTLVHCSRPVTALEKIERAVALNPLSPDTYYWTAAGANYALRRFDIALDYIGKMDDTSLADRLSAASWAMLGNKEKAHLFVLKVREANPAFDVDKWLSLIPTKEQWHRDLYREGLKKAGF